MTDSAYCHGRVEQALERQDRTRREREELEELYKMPNEDEVTIPPVDRSKRCSSKGGPLQEGYDEINPATGQQRDYVALCPAERAKGFVRPVRLTYLHKKCGTVTTMVLSLAETYARDPTFYSGTFCCACRTHFPLDQFVWDGTDEQLGT